MPTNIITTMDIATNSPHGISNKDAERFRNKVEVGSADACWNWLAGKNSDGYGSFHLCGKKWGAHRVSVLLNGRDPTGNIVRHNCDNPSCVNPYHLELGTHRDNVHDKIRKERQARGEQNGRSKLTAESVRSIRASDRPAATLAREHGVSERAIHKVMKRETWRHLDSPPSHSRTYGGPAIKSYKSAAY